MKKSELTTFYLNGLGDGNLRRGEEMILHRRRDKGIRVLTANINWRSAETFPELRSRTAEKAQTILSTMSELGTLAIEGTSAGESLAINVFKDIDDPRVIIIGHSGRIAAGKLPCWDPRNLARCAHLGTDEASQSFYDSVLECENETIPSLGEEDKARMIKTIPWADEVVPLSTMHIDGVRTVTVPMLGHAYGIGLGMLKMPSLAQEMLSISG